MTTVILVLVALIVIAIGIIWAMIRNSRQDQKEIESLKNELERARINVEQLQKYIDEVLKIKTDTKDISERIKEAKTDEEVNSIISDIIKCNNDRVQNSGSETQN